VFCYFLGLHFFKGHKNIRKKATKEWIILNITINALVLLTHYIGMFTVFVEMGTLLIFFFKNKITPKIRKQWILYYLPFLVLGLAFIPYLYIQLNVGGFAPKWIALMFGAPDVADLYLQATLMKLRPFNINNETYRELIGGLIFVFMLGNVIQIESKFKISFAKDFKGWFFGFLYTTPIIVFWVVSQIEPMFVSRYFIPYNFVFYILLVSGLFSQLFSKVAIPFLMIFVIGFFMYTDVKMEKPYHESDWKTKTEIIKESWQEDDVIFVIPHGDLIRIKFYSGDDSSLKIEKQLYKDIFKAKPNPVNDQDLRDVFMNWNYSYKRLWFHEEINTGLSAEFYVQEEGFIFSFLNTHFTKVEGVGFEDERGRLSLFVLDNKN